MRRIDFKDAEKLCPYEHTELGVIYIPELSEFELEDATATVTQHSIKLAENTFAESKEMDMQEPVTENFNFEAQKVAVWQGRKKPENLYEQKVMSKAALTFTEVTLTMFLCDEQGNCLCPFTEVFGTQNYKRINLFGKFVKDAAAVAKFNEMLLGIKADEEGLIPNVKKGNTKKKN